MDTNGLCNIELYLPVGMVLQSKGGTYPLLTEPLADATLVSTL